MLRTNYRTFSFVSLPTQTLTVLWLGMTLPRRIYSLWQTNYKPLEQQRSWNLSTARLLLSNILIPSSSAKEERNILHVAACWCPAAGPTTTKMAVRTIVENIWNSFHNKIPASIYEEKHEFLPFPRFHGHLLRFQISLKWSSEAFLVPDTWVGETETEIFCQTCETFLSILWLWRLNRRTDLFAFESKSIGDQLNLRHRLQLKEYCLKFTIESHLLWTRILGILFHFPNRNQQSKLARWNLRMKYKWKRRGEGVIIPVLGQ